MEYYRPIKVSPTWYKSWEDELGNGKDIDAILDELCKSACGIENSAPDRLQDYARHLHAHLIAAYRLGIKSNVDKTKEE